MKHILTLSAFAFLATACAVTPSYGPAMSTNDFGYRTQMIEQDRARVSYRAPDVTIASDGALRRAAEVTVDAGYDYFTIVTRDTEDARDGRRSGPSIGIGGSTGSGRYGSGGRVGVGVNIPVGAVSSGGSIVRLEVIFGRGVAPQGSNSYNARQVLSSMVPNNN